MRSTIFLLLLLFPISAAAQSLPLDFADPQDGAVIAEASPVFAGTTAADATVTVTVDGADVVTTANATGNWTVQGGALEDGSHTATALATDGVVSSPEVSVSFVVDTLPPALVVVDPKADELVDSTFEVSGNSDPQTAIEVYVDDVLVGSTTAAEGGAWSVIAPADGELAPGPHALGVTARDEAGNESALTIAIEVRAPIDRTDTDGDGLIDSIERTIGTDIESADTDGDGLSDFDEFDDHRTNPRAVDTDGDGIGDADELADNTNPRLQDTDGGGVIDPDELANGTNPRDPSDDYPMTGSTGGGGCRSVPGRDSGWLLLIAIAFKRRQRR